MKRKAIGSLALCTASLAVMAAYGADSNVLTVDTGASKVIDKTLNLSELKLADGASLKAAPDHGLTMTVNGISTAIKPGTYKGKIVLTPTEDVVEKFNDMGLNETYHYRAALFVDNGKRVSDKSVFSAIVGGTVTDTAAKNISITSNEDNFNGIFITGDTTYTLDNPKITFTGNGGNDFVGYGAAIKTAGNAKVTINNAKIKNIGVVRTAVFVGGNSDVTVNNADIEVRNGTLPADYKGGPITGKGGVMMEPPWTLGAVGNVRATNVVGNGTVHYNNSHIKAQGWGALSTDATQNVKLYATNTVVETIDSGYGAYADGVSLDTFSGCTFKVADYGLIMTGGSGVFTDKSTVTSGRFGVMMHSGGSGTLTIDKGSEFNTKEAVIQVKSSYPHIIVDNAKLVSGNNIILEAIVNDDPFAGAGMGAGAEGAGGPPAGGAGGPPPGGAGGPPPGGAGGPPPGGAGMGPGAQAASTGPKTIEATFRNVTLNGDILNSMTSLAGMKVSLENATISGAISTGTAKTAGEKPTAKTYKLIGKMTHTLGRTDNNTGLDLSLGKQTKWVVNRTSYLTGLSIADGASITAPSGYSVSLSVDGKDQPLRAGTYKGAVVVKVNKS